MGLALSQKEKANKKKNYSIRMITKLKDIEMTVTTSKSNLLIKTLLSQIHS